jgi:chemotaxis-related protein WspD
MMHSYCWREIGISGDRSCRELTTLIHCRNCSVYARNARQVFDRPRPDETTERAKSSQCDAIDEIDAMPVNLDWSSTAGDPDDEMGRNAVAIFRLEQEWFSLPATLFHRIVPWASPRPIPHRSNHLLQGLVNVQGELLLCVSLAQLLELPKVDRPSPQHRLAIIEWEGDRWTFPVDEFQGIETIPPPTLLTPPATVLRASQTYTHSLLPWNDRTINCLDETLIFNALARKAMP